MKSKTFLAAPLLLALLTLVATPAHAARDAVQFGSDIHVTPDSPVRDAVCFFCSVDAQGPVEHDIVVFFGDVHIHTAASHDIVNFFGDIHVDDNAKVAHDVVSFFGGVHLGENASIGNDMVVMFGIVRAASSATVSGNRVFQPVWVLFVPLLVLAGLIYAVVTVVRSYRHRHYYPYPMPPPPPPAPPVPPTQT